MLSNEVRTILKSRLSARAIPFHVYSFSDNSVVVMITATGDNGSFEIPYNLQFVDDEYIVKSSKWQAELLTLQSAVSIIIKDSRQHILTIQRFVSN